MTKISYLLNVYYISVEIRYKYNTKTMINIGILAVLFLMPIAAFAQASESDFGEFSAFVGKILSFINSTLIPLIFGIALLVFLYGIFKFFILGGGDENKRDEGKQMMLWSVIGFVAMVSIFGIVNLIAGGFGFSSDESIENIPNAPTSNS